MKQKLFKKRSLALWTALSLILSGLSLPPLEAEAEVGTNETVVYVDGVNGNDVSAGDSADTAVKTMGAAFAKVPTDNTKTTIVISGDVDLSNSGLVNYNDAGYETTDSDFDYTYIIPAHSGEVVITSKLGQEDYTDTASLNFGSENKYSYILEGSITFADIKVSNYASVIYANFYNLTLGQGITSTSDYYPAKVVYLGYWRAKGSYNKTEDSAFVMNSGKLEKFYAGTCSWDTTFSKMSTTINGGTIGTLYGTTNWSAKNASSMQSKVQIAINGGTVNTCYGVCNMAYVGDGGVSITLNKDANVTTVSAVEPVKGTRVAKLDGKATLSLVGYDAEAEVPATISDFDYLELTNSAVEIGTLWEKLTDVYMTDNSSLTLGAVPAANINVTVQKSGENWIADTALVTAPLAAASMITLTADAEDDFTGYEFKSESGANVTWAISSEEGSGDGSGEGNGEGVTDSVIYVDGVGGDDAKAGTSAATALKTMAAAYAKIPSDNTKTTIVVSGDVDLSNSGLVDYGTIVSGYDKVLMIPAHSGVVVITSKLGEEDYTSTASLNFGTDNQYEYILQGSTTFADINISSYAKAINAGFYNLTLGDGITGTSTYYPARNVWLGFKDKIGIYNETEDSAFVMNSGKLKTFYSGAQGWDTTFSKMSVTINGGSLESVYGTTNWFTNRDAALQDKVQITINGGEVDKCYGLRNNANVGDGGVSITLNKNAKVNTVSALEGAKATLSGKATLSLVGFDANTALPTAITGFHYLELTNSDVKNAALWEGLTDVFMTDNCALTLGAVPAANVNVTVQKSGENWIKDTVLVTVPLAAADMITLTANAEDDFTGYEFKSQSGTYVTWKISEAEGSGGDVTESVIYVDGVNGDDTKAGTSAATALKTMGAAYAKILSGNTKTTIVISGDVDLSNSSLIDYSVAYEADYTDTFMFPAHSGEVVITSKLGEEDYTGTASLSFGDNGKYTYMMQGSTTFADINITSYAMSICGNFYNLTLGEGIIGTSTFYPAKTVYLGYWRQKGSYNETDDSAFIMNSGKLNSFYAGTQGWNTTYSKMSATINGGTIGTLYGTTNYSNKNASSLQSRVLITINGGTVSTCYGVDRNANVGDGGVSITIKKDAVVTTVSAVEPPNSSGTSAILTGKATLNLIGFDENATLPTTISGFDYLGLTNSDVTITESLATMWEKVTRVTMTDDSLLKLDVTPTTPVDVFAKKSGDTWNTASAIITAPAGTSNVFTVVSPIDYDFAYASDDTAATWTLKNGELRIGQLSNENGVALNVDLKLPDGVNHTPLDADATAYEFYQAKLQDMTNLGIGEEVVVVQPVEIKGQVEIYVDPVNGNDSNRGSFEAPYQTIQKAIGSVELLQTSEEPYAGIVVYLRGGNYAISETLTLGKAHSGRNGVPVIFSAYNDEEVVISGGTSIAGSAFAKAKDLSQTAYDKLPVSVRDTIIAVDLTQHGISLDDFSITTKGPNYQVFVDGEELSLSRYPNTTNLALTGEVLHIGYVSASYGDWPAGTNKDDPDIRFEMTDMRPTLWENDGHIWLNGSMYAEWDIQNIRVKEANASTGVMRLDGGSTLGALSSPTNTYYYYNIIEELDVPGEYYVDKATGIMYMYPVGNMENATVTFSVMQDNLISLSETENVVFNGLTIENGGNYGIYMTNCKQILVQNCTLRNLGFGIKIHGQKNGIIYSDIYKIGNEPVYLSKTPKLTEITPEQNFVQNCYIHNVGTVNLKICDVYVNGVGNVVSHNLLQGMYGVGIYFGNAKDCIVEYNEITGAPTGVNDYGAIYSKYVPSNTNNHIRYNYIHDIGLFSEENNPQAIYLDEGTNGCFVYGNICSNVPRGFFTNSGRHNVVVNNIVQDGREKSTYSIYASDNFKDYTIEKRFKRSQLVEIDYNAYWAMTEEQRTNLKNRDPLQAKFYEDIKAALDAGSDGVGLFASVGNYAHDNLIYDHGEVKFAGTGDIGGNVTAATNPFVNVAEHNFNLVDDTLITWEDKLPSMDKIGVLTDTKQAVSSFSMYAPANGDQKADPFKVLLRWTCAGGADSYVMEISKNQDMSDARIFDTTKRFCYFENDEFFTYDETYYWRVTAYTVAESRQAAPVKANDGAVYSFKTMTSEEYLESNPLNTEKLEETIALAEEFAAQVKDIGEGGLYPDGSSELLEETILNAKEVMETLIEQDQISVNKANNALEDAIYTVKYSRAIQYVTFENIDATEWEDKADDNTQISVAEDELQLVNTNNDRSEAIYAVEIGNRDILSFQYKIDEKNTWNGFAIAQTIPTAFITSRTEGYFICINPGQIELQKYQGGKKVVQINKAIDDTIFDGGEFYDVEIGAINNADGSVSIHFKINDTVIFDMAEYTDTETDENLPGNPIAGYGTFGVVVNQGNGTTHIKKADNTSLAYADYSALDEEAAKEPTDADAYTADSWAAYQEVLESAENMARTLTEIDQSVVDGYVEALKEAREALVKKPAVEILTDGTDTTYEKGSNVEVSIHCDGALSDFVGVEMDGVEVASTNYTVEEGSTILTFKTEYLETLSAAEHTVTLKFNGGRSVDSKLEVTEDSQQGGGSGEGEGSGSGEGEGSGSGEGEGSGSGEGEGSGSGEGEGGGSGEGEGSGSGEGEGSGSGEGEGSGSGEGEGSGSGSDEGSGSGTGEGSGSGTGEGSGSGSGEDSGSGTSEGNESDNTYGNADTTQITTGTSVSATPNTGDDSNIFVWIMLLGLSILLGTYVLYRKGKQTV